MKTSHLSHLILFTLCMLTVNVYSQGADTDPSARMRLILSEILPGIYDNTNQVYFDRRRGLDEDKRHARVRLEIERVSSDQQAFGFLVNRIDTEENEITESWNWQLLIDPDLPDQVRMREYIADNKAKRINPDCDILWQRRAGHFYGSISDQCDQAIGEHMVSNDGLWFYKTEKNNQGQIVPGHPDNIPFELERARQFHCYADVPGVGGGRAIPYTRHGPYLLHDKGGSVLFTSNHEGEHDIRITLNQVVWRINNEPEWYTRDSLVLYVQKYKGDETIESQYSFTEPDSDRIGINVNWTLVNCAMTPRSEARPQL